MRGVRRWLAANPGLTLALTIVAIWAAAAAQWIVTDSVVPWDSKNQSYAFFRFLASALHAGASPFWNPYQYGGHPAVADPQSLVFAPAFVLWALFDAAPSMRAFDLIVYAHLLAGGLALGAIGRRAGWPLAACVMAAAVFMFGGSAAARLQHTGMIVTYGLFPPALLLLQMALQRGSYALALACAAVSATLIVGRNQVALLLAFVLVAAALAEAFGAEQPRPHWRQRLTVLATIGVAGLALSAVPVLLTVQFAALSNRPAMGLEEALDASLYPANFATVAIANIFGTNILPSAASHYPYWGPNYDTLPEVGATDFSFNYLFVGVSTVIVILWLGVIGGGAVRRGRRLLAGIVTLSTLYMLGRYTPFYALAFEWVPGVSQFRRPVDASFVFLATLALLAGHLMSDYVGKGLPRSAPLRTLATTGAAAAIIVWAVVFSAGSARTFDSLMEVLKVAPIAVAVIALLLWSKTAGARQWSAILIAAVAVGELLWWNAASRLNAEARHHYAVLERPVGPEAEAISFVQRAVAAEYASGARPRVEIIGLGGAWQNLASVVGLEATTGYNPLRIGHYDRLVAPGETTYLAEQRSFPQSFESYDCALARALGLHYLILGQPVETLPHLSATTSLEVLRSGPQVWIYRVGTPLPRVSFDSRIVVADTAAAGSGGRPGSQPSSQRALIEGEIPAARTYFSGNGQARLISWRPDRVEVQAQSSHGGVLVLHDLHYPGWVAEIDGVPTPILRANRLFRAVETPPGARRIVFRYAPLALPNLAAAFTAALERAAHSAWPSLPGTP